MKTIDGKPLADVFEIYAKRHLAQVSKDKNQFERHYRTAAEMVFNGTKKDAVIDSLAPWSCDITQSNGVVSGANQAARLLTFCD